MRVVALVPARGGSKRIPRKNLEKVGGLTLVERAIKAARESRWVTSTYVSSDDDQIIEVALAAGAQVVKSGPPIHTDVCTMEEVVKDFLRFSDAWDDDDILVLLEPTAPLRLPSDIDAIVELMIATRAPAARTVARWTGHRACHSWAYMDVGLASAIRVGSFRECLFPPGTLLAHGGDDRAVDVDEPTDLERARALV
ncbi:MAG: hypothetical protein HY323_08025 [Betaproteobacteria bacterium]|nr:hypothetical protein [Betaproteobacteria bacterium]